MWVVVGSVSFRYFLQTDLNIRGDGGGWRVDLPEEMSERNSGGRGVVPLFVTGGLKASSFMNEP